MFPLLSSWPLSPHFPSFHFLSVHWRDVYEVRGKKLVLRALAHWGMNKIRHLLSHTHTHTNTVDFMFMLWLTGSDRTHKVLQRKLSLQYTAVNLSQRCTVTANDSHKSMYVFVGLSIETSRLESHGITCWLVDLSLAYIYILLFERNVLV